KDCTDLGGVGSTEPIEIRPGNAPAAAQLDLGGGPVLRADGCEPPRVAASTAEPGADQGRQQASGLRRVEAEAPDEGPELEVACRPVDADAKRLRDVCEERRTRSGIEPACTAGGLVLDPLRAVRRESAGRGHQ